MRIINGSLRPSMEKISAVRLFILVLISWLFCIKALAGYDDSQNNWLILEQGLYIDTKTLKKLEKTRYIQVLSKIENGSQELFYLQLVDCEHQKIGIQKVVRTQNKEFIDSVSFWNNVNFKSIESNHLKMKVYQFICEGIEA